MIGLNHKSSDIFLKRIVKKYNYSSKSFTTSVRAKNCQEMMNILKFDFYKYFFYFKKYYNNLLLFIQKYSNKKGEIILNMYHNAYIIYKK